jgi:hypothetical protein
MGSEESQALPSGRKGHAWGRRGGKLMAYTMDALKAKVKEMFPDIDKYQMECDLVLDAGKDAYIIKLTKGDHVLTTHLEKADADACMQGRECVHLGVQMAQFVKNFELAEGIK